MDTFIAALEKFKTDNYANLHLVIGNESCDLDSAVSAFVYAAFLHWQYFQIKCKVCTRSRRDERVYKDDVFIPVMNVDREDFGLKTEVVFCFAEHGIDGNKLVFRDDFDFENLLKKSKATVTLVDHHVLAKSDRFLAPYVTEIIDHRPIDKTEWPFKPDTRTTIEVVGSCCTLVAQRIRNLENIMGKKEDFFEAYPICTDMLHGVIVLDTVNFSKELKKATTLDEEIVIFLENILKPTSCEEHRKCKLDRLVEARKDVSSLSAAQLLRKDVKIVGNILVPSFPILVEEFLAKPAALEAAQESLVRCECAIALLLGMSLASGLTRDVAVVSKDQELASKLAKQLETWTPTFQLKRSDRAGCIYFKQLNLTASRKQFIPALNDFLRINT